MLWKLGSVFEAYSNYTVEAFTCWGLFFEVYKCWWPQYKIIVLENLKLIFFLNNKGKNMWNCVTIKVDSIVFIMSFGKPEIKIQKQGKWTQLENIGNWINTCVSFHPQKGNVRFIKYSQWIGDKKRGCWTNTLFNLWG